MRDQEIRGLYEAYHSIYSQEKKVEAWVNALIEEGYDLSKFTWEDMCEMYMGVYSNLNHNQDIVEVATEYFYTYGLNEDGIDILIEKVGLDNFVEFVYDLSEDLTHLTEARSARRRTGGPSVQQVKDDIAAREAKRAAIAAAKEEAKKRKESESGGPDTEAKEEQPRSKRPIRDAIAKRILDGMERHRQATQTAGRLAGETGRTLGRIASFAGEAGRRASQHIGTHGMRSLANSFDPFDTILEYLVAEGYADTNDNAIAIMANMSEEWREEIIVEARHEKHEISKLPDNLKSNPNLSNTIKRAFRSQRNVPEQPTGRQRKLGHKLSALRYRNQESDMEATGSRRGPESPTDR